MKSLYLLGRVNSLYQVLKFEEVETVNWNMFIFSDPFYVDWSSFPLRTNSCQTSGRTDEKRYCYSRRKCNFVVQSIK